MPVPRNRSVHERRQRRAGDEPQRWPLSDRVLFGVLSSLLLWTLIIVGVQATFG